MAKSYCGRLLNPRSMIFFNVCKLGFLQTRPFLRKSYTLQKTVEARLINNKVKSVFSL